MTSKTSNPTIAAVLVTYNRSKKLKKAIDAVLRQTKKPDVIYVVDNASTDDTPEMLNTYTDPSVLHIRLEKNVGGAGGFHEGVKKAHQDGHDFVWISDDDAYPEADAIEVLVNELQQFDQETGLRVPFVCSRVDWKDGSICEMNIPNTVWDWPRWYEKGKARILVGSCSFVSVLIPRWAITEHGLPLSEYFIWHDDVEFTTRLARSYPGILCLDSVVIHDTAENKGVNYGYVTPETLWKFKSGARNETSRRLRDRGIYGIAAFTINVRSQMKLANISPRLRFPIYYAIWRGLWFKPKIKFA